MRKRLMVAIMALLSMLPAAAAGWEIAAGGGAGLTIPISSSPFKGAGYYPGIGIEASADATYFPSDMFGISTGIRGKLQAYIYANGYSGFISDLYFIDDIILEIPAMLRFRLPDGLSRWMIGIGGYASWRFGRFGIGYSDNQSAGADGYGTRGDVLFFSPIPYTAEESRFNAGLSIEASYDRPLSEKEKLRMALRYDAGLLSLYRAEYEMNMTHMYCHTLTFSVQYVWTPGEKE